MTYIQWLYRAYNLQEESDELHSQLCREREKLMRMSASLDCIPVTSTKDPHKFDAIADLTRHYESMMLWRAKILTEVNLAIEQVPNLKFRQVLRHRFVDSWSMSEIAESIDKSERQTYRIYRSAMRTIKPIVEEMMKR